MRTGWIVLAGLALAALVGCDGGSEPAGGGNAPAPVTRGAAIDAEAVMKAKCAGCHGLDKVDSHHFDEAKWTETIDEMIGKGAQVTADERAAIIAFLAARDKDVPKTEH